MNRLILSLIAGAGLSGCVASPVSPWEGLTVDTSPAATAVDCGSFPYPSEVVGDSIVYDNAGANDLEDYRVCSEANAGIVQEHAAQIGQLKVARASLVEAGRSQRAIADMRSEMLADERQHHFWSSIGYWVLIIGAVAL